MFTSTNSKDFFSALILQVETSQPKGHYWKIDTNWKINNNNNNGWSRPIRLTWQWRFALECSRKYKMMRVKTCQTTRNHPDNKTETSYNEKYSTFSQPPNQPSKKNKLPSLGFECTFLYLDSSARNVKVVWFVDQIFIHLYNLVVIIFEVEILPTQILQMRGVKDNLK